MDTLLCKKIGDILCKKGYPITKKTAEKTAEIINKINFKSIPENSQKWLDITANNAVQLILTSSEDMRQEQMKILNIEEELPQNEEKLSITEFIGLKTMRALQLYFNPESLYEHYYLVLDTDYRDQSGETKDSTNKLRWNYTSRIASETTGYCFSVGEIKNIIGMRVYQPNVQYQAAMDTSAKRVSLLFEEFLSQVSYSSSGKYHFLFRPDYTTATTLIELTTEDFNDGIYMFRTPIKTFSTMTLIFGDPDTAITFTKPLTRFQVHIKFICMPD